MCDASTRLSYLCPGYVLSHCTTPAKITRRDDSRALIKSSTVLGMFTAPPCAQTFNDPVLLPGPKDPGLLVDESGQLHALHPLMQQRKLHERPFNALRGTRNHNENVYDSTLENYCPTAWNTLRSDEPLLPVRRTGVP